MTPRIAYYAHHHGRGHVARAAAVLAHVEAEATVFTSAAVDALEGARLVHLPPDTPAATPASGVDGVLHYAPVGHEGVRRRMAALAAWAAAAPGLLVADVSVEVALLGRLLSLPVVVVRQHGSRTDGPHRAAYRAARAVWAPYSRALAEPSAPAWLRSRTHHTGGFSRLEGRAREVSTAPRHVVVMGGGGSDGVASASAWSADDVAAAARATPDWRWTVLGRTPRPSAPTPSVRWLGWVDDPAPVLRSASVVVSAAGHNAVMDAAAVGRPLVVIPETRPFGEQRAKAEALGRCGAALVRPCWPAPAAWPELLDSAGRQDTAPLSALVDGGGARRAVRLLDRLARAACAPQTVAA